MERKSLLLSSAILLVCCLSAQFLSAQQYTGSIICKNTGKPVEYANIGVINKETGTVSDDHGKYSIDLTKTGDSDTLMVSCIGYYPYKTTVAGFKSTNGNIIILEQKTFALNEVVIRPGNHKKRILGYRVNGTAIAAGFNDNSLGYECGVIMKTRKPVLLETLCLDIQTCKYDTLFYRVNVYKQTEKGSFENVLNKPIYINLTRKQIRKRTEIDIKPYNITMDADFLVTIEHIRNLGKNGLYFRCRFPGRTWVRKTSQGSWKSFPLGLGVSIDVIQYDDKN